MLYFFPDTFTYILITCLKSQFFNFKKVYSNPLYWALFHRSLCDQNWKTLICGKDWCFRGHRPQVGMPVCFSPLGGGMFILQKSVL